MNRFLIVVGIGLLALFCGYKNTIRRTDQELIVVTTCFGVECCDVIRVEESMIQAVDCYYGHRSSPYLRARLRNGQFKVLVWPWRPIYDEHKLATQVNLLPKNGIDTVIVLPLWWALVLGVVLIIFGMGNYFGVVRVISEEEWMNKYDLLERWTRYKEEDENKCKGENAD